MNILLIDDHALFAKSLEIALEDHSEIKSFKSFSDISEALGCLEKSEPDIVLIDINLKNISDEDGIILAEKILIDNKNINIVFLTGYDLPVYRFEARKIGAKGFINKNIDPNNLVEILKKIRNGSVYFPKVDYIEELTESEKQVLQFICNGKKRKEIAQSLYLSERTVSNHLQHIFSKLDVSSSIEAVTKGLQLGYILPPQEFHSIQ